MAPLLRTSGRLYSGTLAHGWMLGWGELALQVPLVRIPVRTASSAAHSSSQQLFQQLTAGRISWKRGLDPLTRPHYDEALA